MFKPGRFRSPVLRVVPATWALCGNEKATGCISTGMFLGRDSWFRFLQGQKLSSRFEMPPLQVAATRNL